MSIYASAWDDAHKGRLMIAPHPDPRFIDCIVALYGEVEFAKRRRVSCLEIGCGTGINVEWLADQGYTTYGFDSSHHAIDRAHARLFRGKRTNWPQLLIADATKPWPYRNGSIDFAFDICALENLNEDEVLPAFEQLGRVLKPDGYFFCLTASTGRDDTLTTAGKARRISDDALIALLDHAGLRADYAAVEQHKDRHERIVENWHVRASRK